MWSGESRSLSLDSEENIYLSGPMHQRQNDQNKILKVRPPFTKI